MKVRSELHRLGCYWRKESLVKLRRLFCGGDFVDDRFRGGARIGRGKNGPATIR